jgi:protein phosphatase
LRARLVVGYLSDVGLGREQQEDAYACQLAPPDPQTAQEKGAILVVAGGEGANEVGAVASRMAVRLVREHYYATPSDYPVEALRQAMIAANAAIYAAAQAPGHEEMAATCGLAACSVACAVVQGSQLVVGEAGDCRVYLLRGGDLSQLTREAPPPARKEAARPCGVRGQAPGAAKRALGAGPQIEPEIHAVGSLREGDRLLLCTDGLYGAVGAAQIAAALAEGPPEATCHRLVDLANAAGAPDNTAVIVAEVHLEPGARGTLVQARKEARAGPPQGRPAPAARVAVQEVAEPAELAGRERALADRERHLRKLEAVLAARERAVEEAERKRAEESSARAQSELEAARAQMEALHNALAEIGGHLAQLRRGYERLDEQLRELAEHTVALRRGQDRVQAELAGQRQELARWAERLSAYEQSLRDREEQRAPAPALARSEREPPVSQVPPMPGATALYGWECAVGLAAPLDPAGFEQTEAVQLPDGRVVECGLSVPREFLRRQYPIAVEVWARAEGRSARRLLVGYGLDVRTIPADTLQTRGVATVVNGDEVVVWQLGEILVYAAVTQCHFATVARHKVSRDGAAFAALAVCFAILAPAERERPDHRRIP